MIGNQMHFSQLTQKFSSELTDKQIQWLLRYIMKQSFNFVSQSCKLHSENRELIIMLHAESFPFFHVNLTLQVILIVFIKITEQIWINFKVQMIIAVLFMIQNTVYFII